MDRWKITVQNFCLFSYSVVVEGERGNRPRIYSLEQLLQEAVRPFKKLLQGTHSPKDSLHLPIQASGWTSPSGHPHRLSQTPCSPPEPHQLKAGSIPALTFSAKAVRNIPSGVVWVCSDRQLLSHEACKLLWSVCEGLQSNFRHSFTFASFIAHFLSHWAQIHQ